MASRKEEKERRRQERLAKEAQVAREHSRRQRIYAIVAGAVLVAGVIAAVIVIASSGGGSDSGKGGVSNKPESKFSGALSPPPQSETDLFSAAKKAGCVLQNPPVAGREHIPSSQPVHYKTNPPTSGNHDQIPEPDGVYSAYPQPRHFVHTLEGGRVEIQYKPSIPNRRIAQLGGVFNKDSLYLLMFPNPKIPYDVAVASWGHLAGCKKVTNATYDVVRDFIQRYRDTAPEPAATHQPAVNQPGWPGPTPPLHEKGAIPEASALCVPRTETPPEGVASPGGECTVS